MKQRWVGICLLAAVTLVLAGCAAPEVTMTGPEEEGGENMQVNVDPYRAEGTPLDRRPGQTALATFALG